MSVVLLAIGTTRARAVNATAEFLLARNAEVALITVDAAAWAKEGLPGGVRLYPLGEGEQRHPLFRLGRLVERVNGGAYRLYAKLYRLLRPYVLWRVARRGAARSVDWNAIEQLVICDSHAIPIGWHLAKRHPELTVGFELDRAACAQRPPAAAAVTAAASTASPSPIRPAGIDVDADA